MTEFIPNGYLDIYQVIEKVGTSLFSNWKPESARKSITKESERGHVCEYWFLDQEQKESIKKSLKDNCSNNDQKKISTVFSRFSITIGSHPYYSNDIKLDKKKTTFDLASKEDCKILEDFCKVQEVRDRIRQALSANKLIAYVLSSKSGKKTPLEADLWNVDKHWHLLVLDGSSITNPSILFGNNLDWIASPRENILFEENNVDDFLLSDKAMDSSHDGIIGRQLLKGIEDGTIKLRASQRLFLCSIIQFYEKETLSEYIKGGENKGKLDTIITNRSKDFAFTIIESVKKHSSSLKKMTPEQLEQFEQTHVTEKEIEDISKLIRPLHKQK